MAKASDNAASTNNPMLSGFQPSIRASFSADYYPWDLSLSDYGSCPFLLTVALPRVDKIIYFILLFWAIPFPPLIQIPKYGVYEDTIMFAIGIYSLIMLVKNWKEKSAPNQGIHPTS